jgi:hypothetical protein
MIRTQGLDPSYCDPAKRWVGQGGHSFFINFLQRVVRFAYGRQLAARFRHQCYAASFGLQRFMACGFCGTIVNREEPKCFVCQARVPGMDRLDDNDGGEAMAFYRLLGQYVISLQLPRRALTIAIIFDDMRCWPEQWEPCLGCATLLQHKEERISVTVCSHLGGHDVVYACSKPWCHGPGSLVMTFCTDDTCPLAEMPKKRLKITLLYGVQHEGQTPHASQRGAQ